MLQRIALALLLSVTMVAAQKISKIEMKGFGDADKLKPVLGIKVGDQYTQAKIERAKKAILKTLELAGYLKNSVKASSEKSDEGIEVTFDISRGDKIKITKVTFSGNKNISDEDLKKNLVNKESDFMLLSWLPGFSSGEGNKAQLKYDWYRVRDEYLKHGYIDVQVRKPKMKLNKADLTAEVYYSIKEGKPYKVGSVKLVGSADGMDKKAVKEALELKAKETFDVSKLRNDMRMLTETVGNLGYAYAKIAPKFRKNPRNRTLSVVYVVKPGMKVKIGNVEISGNEKTKDHVVRRYVTQAPGDLYNYTELKESKKVLKRTGYFEQTSIKPKKGKGNTVDLLVDVKEAKTGALTFGGGYGSADGFMVNGSVSEKNLFGTGIAASAAIEYSIVKQKYNISFNDPRVFDSLYSLGVGVYYEDADYTESDDYESLAYGTKQQIGGYFSVGRQFGKTLHTSVGYSYNDVEYGDINVTNPTAIQLENYIKSSIIASVVFDNTDDYYTPREGFYAKLALEYAGLGSDSDGKQFAEFIKTSGKFAAYYGLKDYLDYDLIMRYKLRANHISDEGYVPLAEKLYLGGARRGVRGFSSGSISPYDIDPTNPDARLIGGMMSMVNSIEASIPLSQAAKMRLTFFADYGMIGTDSLDEIVRSSVGAQVEWRSPFGAINLIFAKPLDEKDYDNTANFEFSMGTKF